LIDVPTFDRNRAFQIIVTIAAKDDQPEVLYDGNPYVISLRRNVPNTSSGSLYQYQPKPFIQLEAAFPAYQSTDTDIQSIWGLVKPEAPGSGIVYLAMYVLSYGVVDITTDVFSTAVWLGYASILTNQ